MKRRWMGWLVAALWPLSGCAQPDACVVIAVKDEDGSAVTNVPVAVGTFVRRIPGTEAGSAETAQVEARTDTNGFARLTIPSRRGDLYIGMQPTEGFYYDRGIELRMTNAVGGRWEPWGQTNVLVVRRIVNPIPMFANLFPDGDLRIPINGSPVGFDLMKGDWLAPFGHGQVPDLVFTVAWDHKGMDSSRHLNYAVSMTLAFSNEGDGILEVPIPVRSPPQGSSYRMPRLAPEDGYLPKYYWEQTRQNGKVTPWLPEDRNYFIRVRTQMDNDGRIRSALYGKIHGPILVSVRPAKTTVEMAYYLNPTPNDRNTEFAVGKNLMKPPPSISIGDP